MASFADLIEKIGRGVKLKPLELAQLRDEARAVEEVKELVKSLIQPGTGTLIVNNLQVAGGDVSADENGIFIKNNQEASLAFGDPTNLHNVIYIVSDLSGFLVMVSNYITGGVKQLMKFAAGGSAYTKLYEDPAQADRVLYEIVTTGAQGARFTVGQGLIDLRTEGSSGGSTFMRMRETSNTPPGGGTDAYHMYMKGDKLIIQFNASGTAHYFYLDLTATANQSWIYSATAP